MATGDGRYGELRAGTYGRGIWEIPLLTAAYAGGPGDDAEPGEFDVCGAGGGDGERGADNYGYKFGERRR